MKIVVVDHEGRKTSTDWPDMKAATVAAESLAGWMMRASEGQMRTAWLEAPEHMPEQFCVDGAIGGWLVSDAALDDEAAVQNPSVVILIVDEG